MSFFFFLSGVLFFLSFLVHLLLKSPRVHKFLPKSVSACFFTFLLRGRKRGQARAGSAQGPGRRADLRLSTSPGVAGGGRPRAASRAPHPPRGAAPGWTRTWLELQLEQEALHWKVAGAWAWHSEEPRTFRPVCKASRRGTTGPGAGHQRGARPTFATSYAPRRPATPTPLAPAGPQTAKGS